MTKNNTHTKQNARLVLMYSTVHPFRLRGKIIICVYCCDEFEDPDLYRSHMDENHKTANLNTAFAHTSKCRTREYLKVDCVNLKCKLCNNPLKNVLEVAQHLLECHSEEQEDIKCINLDYEVGLHSYRLFKDNFICTVCDAKLPTLYKLARHMSTHYADYHCDICGKTYLNNDNLKIHVKYSHSGKHQCRKCKEEFASLDEKRDHVRASKKCLPCACVYCGERFASWEKKQKHLVEEHKLQRATYPCPDCDLEFKLRKHFYDHYAATHSDMAFMCSCCGKKFKSKRFLEEHVVSHTGEKQFQCTVCLKMFSRKKSLRQHMWIHSETKRFSCALCDKTFNQKVCYTYHMTNVHRNVSD